MNNVQDLISYVRLLGDLISDDFDVNKEFNEALHMLHDIIMNGEKTKSLDGSQLANAIMDELKRKSSGI